MKKTLIVLLVMLTAFSLMLAACGTSQPPAAEQPVVEQPAEEPAVEEPAEEPVVEEPTEEPVVEEPTTITLTDGRGVEVTLEGPAQRVISLAPSNTELLFAAGAGAQTVAREDFTNFPPEAIELPSVGGGFSELNIELILSLEPDLILAADLTPPEQIQTFEDLGLPIFQIANPTDLPGMFENLRIVAQLTGHVEETEIVIEEMQARIEAVVALIANAETQPVVFYELDSTDPNAPWTSGPDTFIDTLITMAGGINMGAAYEGAWVSISTEEILAQDPDIIILGDSIWGVTPEDVAARPGWETLSAVQNGTVLPFNDDLASRPGPRLVDGLEELARLIHPELFE